VRAGWARGLRLVQAVVPAWSSALATRLFFMPLPIKWVARRQAIPATWALEHWPFECGSIAAYRRCDAQPGRPAVLLLHGWAGDALQMRLIGDALAADGFNPVLLDFPGHGRSHAWQSSLPQFARAIWAASARLGPLHAVVAHSLAPWPWPCGGRWSAGGAVGLAGARRFAGAVHDLVCRQLWPGCRAAGAHARIGRAGAKGWCWTTTNPPGWARA